MTSENTPLECDDLYLEFIEPFWEAPQIVWDRLAEALDKSCPDSAASRATRLA